MRHQNKSAEIPITCPQCGHQFTQTVGSMERNPKFPCPKACGAEVDASGFIEDAQKAVDNVTATLNREIGKLNRRLR
jgi:hypothetical protein